MPPQTTVVFEVPAGPWLVGIDTKFLDAHGGLKGFKLVPPGVHFLHFTAPTEPTVRYGRWIECDESAVYALVWNGDCFDLVEDYSADKVGDWYHQMVPYPENSAVWAALTPHLDMDLIQEFVPYIHSKYCDEISTVTSSTEENMVLAEKLKHVDHNELSFTILDFASKSLDKSAYLEKLYGHDIDILLGEFELSFLMFVILGNFCAGLQWVNLLKLLLMSKTFMLQNKAFHIQFLTLFKVQLEALPEEYVGESVTLSSAVDSKSFIAIMENFVQDIYITFDDSCCAKMKMNGRIRELWNEAKTVIRRKFALDVDKLVTTFDGDFEVPVDLDGEDAPAVVYLDSV